MSVRVFELTAPLVTELHAGRELVGNLLRARAYAGGKAVWGAATSALTRKLYGRPSASDYEATGALLRERVIFGCLFPAVGPERLIPEYTERGIRYGPLSEGLFEYQLVRSRSSTALDRQVSAATEGSLHEVESIQPVCRAAEGGIAAGATALWGHVFLREDGGAVRTSADGPEVKGVSLAGVLTGTQLGGERAYGFGRIGQVHLTEVLPGSFAQEAVGGEEAAEVTLSCERSFPAPVMSEGVNCVRGEATALVGREWAKESGSGAGEWISDCVVCWEPGSVFEAGTRLRLGSYGIWKAVM